VTGYFCHPRYFFVVPAYFFVIPTYFFVIPANAGIHGFHGEDSRLRGNDETE
jgi:hypothetical protein